MASSRYIAMTNEGGSSPTEETFSRRSGVKPTSEIRNYIRTASLMRKSRPGWRQTGVKKIPRELSSSSSSSSEINVIYMMDKNKALYSSSSFDTVLSRPPFDVSSEDNDKPTRPSQAAGRQDKGYRHVGDGSIRNHGHQEPRDTNTNARHNNNNSKLHQTHHRVLLTPRRRKADFSVKAENISPTTRPLARPDKPAHTGDKADGAKYEERQGRRHPEQRQQQGKPTETARRSGKSKQRRLVGNDFSGVNFVDPEFTKSDRRDERVPMVPELPRDALACDRSDNAGVSLKARAGSSSSKEMLWSAWSTPSRSLSSVLTKDGKPTKNYQKLQTELQAIPSPKKQLELSDLENNLRVPAGFNNSLGLPRGSQGLSYSGGKTPKRPPTTTKLAHHHHSPRSDSNNDEGLMEGIPMGPISSCNKPVDDVIAAAKMPKRATATGPSGDFGAPYEGRGRWRTTGQEKPSIYRQNPRVDVGYCDVDTGRGRVNGGAIKGGRGAKASGGSCHYGAGAGDGFHDGYGPRTSSKRFVPVDDGSKDRSRSRKAARQPNCEQGFKTAAGRPPMPNDQANVALKAKSRFEVSTNPVRDRIVTSSVLLSSRSSYIPSQAVVVAPVTETNGENDLTESRRPLRRHRVAIAASAVPEGSSNKSIRSSPSSDAATPNADEQKARSPSTAPSAAAMKLLLNFFDRKLDAAISGRTTEPAAESVERDIAAPQRENDDDDNGTLSLGFPSHRRSHRHGAECENDGTRDRQQLSAFRPYRQLPSSSSSKNSRTKEAIASSPNMEEVTSSPDPVYFYPFGPINGTNRPSRPSAPQEGHGDEADHFEFEPFSVYKKKKTLNDEGHQSAISSVVSNKLSRVRDWCSWKNMAVVGVAVVAAGVAYHMSVTPEFPPSHCKNTLHYYLNPECQNYH